ncbi:MAG: SMC family ATPase [Acidimicrobiia bacterium]|nr:SMC family ATPase [Acidimicrobiia bacterium]
MRPIELTLSGFRSYSGTATFGFEGRHLVGVVGPIGSGKSSLLDAVAFALYGKTPRVGRDIKGLINQRRDEARVALTFSVDGQRWKVVRAMRRKGASAHALYRVEGGEEHEEADREKDVAERIETLLGLDWEGFCRSVMLAQNQFAGFLEATPGGKDGVLKGVFGFERLDAMRVAARQRLDAAAAELAALNRLRAQAEQDRRALEAALAEHATAVGRAEALAALADEVAAADEAGREARRAEQEAASDGARVAGLAARIPPEEKAESVLGAATTAGDEARAAARREQEAVAVAAQADEALAAALEAAGGRPALDEATGLVARAGAEEQAAEEAARRAGAAEEAAQGAAIVSARTAAGRVAAEKERAEAAKAGEKAAAEREKAATALHEAHRREAALTLRAGLEVGAACPVCEQPVTALPRGRKAADAAKAQRALDEAEAAERAARSRVVAAESALAAAREAAEGAGRDEARAGREAAAAREEVAVAGARHRATRERLTGLLGEGDPAALLAGRRSGVAAAEQTAAAARAAAEEAGRRRAALQERGREAEAGLQALATDLAAVAGGLGAEVAAGADPAGLRAALQGLRAFCEGALSRVEAQKKESLARREAAAARRAALLAGASLAPDADVAASLIEARAAVSRLAGGIEVLQGRLSELGRLEEEEQETIARHALLAVLHDDLAPSKFQKYVLDERRRALAALGSEQFEALSGGRYRFSDDGEFAVVDLTAAEAVRPAVSLSGGETFLASLGLALALAEMVSREGGRLDAFFLDEGFGSLDPEHLDLAMEGVERLVAGADRLVVVVSHVAAMRERIEDLIVLGKDDLTGDTMVLQGARPGG